MATPRRLGVYALAENERPSATTRVLHSPVLNVFVDGSLCWGNIPRPRTLDVAAIPDFERALFDSWSTHPNPGQELTVTGKGGLLKLWDDLAARQATRFPVRRLSATDDADDAHSTKIALVLGRLGQPEGPAIASRLCAGGMFLPLPRSPFSGDDDAA